ncbi:hypothetical protein NDU88_004823 [Pleurodeles waltl]|uniref:Uncharacterized protein n=1 Tax=Pleurodeles waltl TaxID=8319 RepID=A0AAV7VI73_PLEWA|nr:hypothetical protein NDU88_004823 [Pleurodeles waltl]
MEQYTTPKPLPQRQTYLGGSGEALAVPATEEEEPSRAELLAAIHGARVALEGKIETVSVEVNLLRADPQKITLRKAGDVGQGWPGSSGRPGVGSAHISRVDGTDWRRHGEGPLRVSMQRCDNSGSRMEIQQYGTMAVVDPEQAFELADSSDGEAGVLFVDS